MFFVLTVTTIKKYYRLARRLKRDITQRGRDIGGVMAQYNNHVKPAYDRYIAPTMQHAGKTLF